MGTLWIRQAGKTTVHEYRNLRRADVEEKIREHMALFGTDAVRDPKYTATPLLDGTGFVPVPVDPKTVTAEWSESDDPDDTVEILAVPTAP